MSEKPTHNKQLNGNLLSADNIDAQQGIEGNDIENEAGRAAESILANHMREYDHFVGAAHDFVKEKLGMVDVQPASRTAVLSTEVAKSWQVGTNGGHFLPELDIAYVFEQSSGRSKTDKLILASSLVHELAHSATVTPENAKTEHSFYHEALAGIAEYFALQNLAEAGEYTQAPDTVVSRNIDGEEVAIVIPGEFRRVDASEIEEDKADSTQALIAAMVVGIGLRMSGQSARDILAMARRGDSAAYDAMKDAVSRIDPELVDHIQEQAGTTDAIIQIAHKAQRAVGII